MKKLLLFVSFFLVCNAALAQHIYQIRADSVRIYNVCDTAELIIENHTQNVPGFLYNKGKGRTEFRRLQDSIYQANGTLYYRKTNGELMSLPVSANETLQSVTGRGSTTDQYIYFRSPSGNPSNGLDWTYNTDYWRIFVESQQDTPSGNMIFESADNDTEGWIFRNNATSGPGMKEILSLGRDRFLYNSNTVYHSGNITFATKGNDIALKTESSGNLGIENWIRTGNNTGFYTNDGSYLYKNGNGSWAIRSTAGVASCWLELQTGDGVNRGGFYADAIGNLGFVNAGANGWRFRLDGTGNAFVNGQVQATGFYQSSMRILKKDIAPYNASALQILNTASVRSFKYKADSAGITHIGFIADEVPGEMAAPGRTGIDEANTVALLVKALQEMSKKVDDLQKTIDALQQKNK